LKGLTSNLKVKEVLMKKKYNLALIPISKSDEVMALAKKFSTIADRYLPGDSSFPHITLYHRP